MDASREALIQMNRASCLGLRSRRQPHELNNLLAITTAYLELLQENVVPEALPLLAKAMAGTERLRLFIQAMRSPLNPTQEGAACAWVPIVDGFRNYFGEEVGRRAQWKAQVEASHRFNADESVVRQIVVNLLNAALLTIEEEDPERHSLSVASSQEDQAELRIASTGSWGPQTEGLRLGVSISQELATSAGGSLEVGAEGGLQFTLRLPL